MTEIIGAEAAGRRGPAGIERGVLEKIEQIRMDGSLQWQVATHLNVSLRTVTSIMRRRIVPYLKISGVIRLDLLEVDRAFKQLGR